MDRLNRDFRRAIDFESFDQGVAGGSVEQRLIERERGLTREQINSIATFRVTSQNMATFTLRESSGSGRKSCSICLNDFSMKDKVKQLHCEHVFHEKCIENWLRRARDCPNCKRSAIAEDNLVPE